MKDLMLLKEEYPQYFGYCNTVKDIIEILDKKHTSRETCYLDRDGIGTYDVNEASIIEHDDYDTCNGFYTVELGIRNVDVIKVIVEFTLEDYDEEEKRYNCESYVEIGRK